MTAIRNNPEERYLDAARECVVSVGVTRTTLTDVARRAGVSRMTLYRSWPDMQSLIADLMTREWLAAAASVASGEGSAPRDVAAGVSAMIAALRKSELFAKIVEVDPELLLPYLLQRRGRSQDAMLSVLRTRIAAGQKAGQIRRGDAGVLARAVLLAAHGFALSAHTMADETSLARLDAELKALVERYLAP